MDHRGEQKKNRGKSLVSPVVPLALQKFRQASSMIAAEGADLIVGLFVMLVVEHTHGARGLGIFAFLMATMFFARYISIFGLARWVELEIAREKDERRQVDTIARGVQAVVCTSVCGGILLLISSVFTMAHTQIGEHFVAYVLLALILPFANLNSLKLAILHGRGQHEVVVWHRLVRHGLLLLAIYFLSSAGFAPSLLLFCYLFAEVVTTFRLRKSLRFPQLRCIFRQPVELVATLKAGKTHVFADNGLDLLLHIDFFILGFVVNEWEIGFYASAAILVRFCLVVSLGLRPLFRRYYSLVVQQRGVAGLLQTVALHGGLLFGLQAVLTLFILMFFPQVLNFFFALRSGLGVSYEIFLIFLPGLLFFSTFSALEPVFEALDEAESLKAMTVGLSILNFTLTAILVPMTGIEGAAVATMLTMLAHFFCFHSLLPYHFPLSRATFVAGAMIVYLLFVLFSDLAITSFLKFFLATGVLLGSLYCCGVLGVETKKEEEIHSV